MMDIERDVDDVVFAEDEHELMMEAEIEHLQREAEIALNTRVDGDVLLPFFGDSNDMMLETSAHASLVVDPTGDALDRRAHDLDDKNTNPFSVMSKQLWKTLHEPMSNGLGTTDIEVGNRTLRMISAVLNRTCHIKKQYVFGKYVFADLR